MLYFLYTKLRGQKLFQQFAACTKGKVMQSPPTVSSPAQPAGTQSCYWPVTDPARKVAHPTAGTGNSVTSRMAEQGPPLFPRQAKTGLTEGGMGRTEYRLIWHRAYIRGMCHILSYHALHANELSGTEAILASGDRFVQHPSVKNLWGNAGPSSPCIFCWEMNVLYSVTFSTILLHF